MKQAIQYYCRKLNNANDLAGVAYVTKLIQLEHQATIDKALIGLQNVQYSRHYPNHLVVQLARLNRPEINDSLINYFKKHFTAENTKWHAISALQDDRVVDTLVTAIKEFEQSYFSQKVVKRCIHLLGRIASPKAYQALRHIIDDYFQTDNRFIDNYELPLAAIALDALSKIRLPEAIQYFENAQSHYHSRIVEELAIYPDRLSKERTSIGIDLHEGSAITRMRQYALPTLVDWHQSHPNAAVRDFALSRLLTSLQTYASQSDQFTIPAVQYLLTQYDELKEKDKIRTTLKILENCYGDTVTDFTWRIFEDDANNDHTSHALQILEKQASNKIYSAVIRRFQQDVNLYDMSRKNAILVQAYISFFGHSQHQQAEDTLIALYDKNLPHFHRSIIESLAKLAQKSDSALDFLNYMIETSPDAFTTSQAISHLPKLGDKTLLILISLLDCGDRRQYDAIEALGILQNPQAIPHLMQSLLNAHDDSELETKIIKAMERIGTETAFEALNAWEAKSR